MTLIQPRVMAAPNYRKWALFALMGLLTLGVISIDERFLIDKTDEEWAHIAPFQWWLLPHGIAGFVALTIGPFQFSQRLRRNHLALHRLMGRIYIAAVCIAVPLRRRPQANLRREFFRWPLAVAFHVENEFAQVVDSVFGEDG